MSRRNAEVVRQLYEAVNVRDVSTIKSLLDPEVVYVPRPDDATTSPYRGRDRAGMERLLDTLNFAGDYRAEPEEIREVADRVLVRFVQTLRPRGSTSTIRTLRFNVWTLRDGRIVEGRVFSTEEEALQAIGLRE